MARIVIVSAGEDSRNQLAAILTSSGFSLYRVCASAGELRRALADCDDGVVVFVGTVPDCKPDELVWDYGERIQVLLIGRPPVLDSCESPEIFRLALPTSSQAVTGAVEMLTQLHRMRLPRRQGTEKELVERAKKLLMKQKGITEPEAHRMLQQYAMNHGVRMADQAASILEASRETEE